MGWVPPKPPAKPEWMSDADYRLLLLRERALYERRFDDYRPGGMVFSVVFGVLAVVGAFAVVRALLGV